MDGPLERFAFHFHKCPNVAEAQKPDCETESLYFGLVHFIVRDPVVVAKIRVHLGFEYQVG